MKRFMKLTGVILAAAVLGSAVSVSAEENLLQKMDEANRNIALLENADRVAFRNTAYDAEGNAYSAYSYGDQERIVYENAGSVSIQEPDALYGFDNEIKRMFQPMNGMIVKNCWSAMKKADIRICSPR